MVRHFILTLRGSAPAECAEKEVGGVLLALHVCVLLVHNLVMARWGKEKERIGVEMCHCVNRFFTALSVEES